MAKRLTGKEEKQLLRKVREKRESAKTKRRAGERKAIRKVFGRKEKGSGRTITETTKPSGEVIRKTVIKPLKKSSSRKIAERRAGKAKAILAAFGVQPTYKSAGRPAGVYKHGVPIQVYKKLQAQRKEQIRRYQQAQQMQYSRRGISPQQLQQMQLRRTMEERNMPPQIQQQMQMMQEPFKGDGPEKAVDDELEFNRWRAKETLSPSANAILTRLRKTQNMGKMANIRQQRILEERRIISQKGNMMKAHTNMIDTTMDFTGVDQTNILMAPNVFKESPDNPHILKTNRPNTLQTGITGNRLRFGRE